MDAAAGRPAWRGACRSLSSGDADRRCWSRRSCRWRRAPTTRSSISGSDGTATICLVTSARAAERWLSSCVFLASSRSRWRRTSPASTAATPGAENRELAAFPQVDRIVDVDRRASAAASSRWFDDHFGFRSALVRWYGESRLFVLDVSPSAAVVKGRDGWFFYGDDKAFEDYANVEPLPHPPEALANWRAAVVARGRLAAARGIAYVFTIAPDKHVIYRGEDAVDRCDGSATCRATDQLFDGAARIDRLAVDVRPALLRAKAHERIYQQTDTHWNDRGALVAYQADHRGRAGSRAVHAGGLDARRLRAGRARDVEALDLAGMMGLKRVCARGPCARAEAPTPGPRRRARRSGADGRSGPPRDRDPGLVAAARRDLPRLVRVAAGAVSVGALQPRGVSVAERFRCQSRDERKSRTSSFRRSSAGICTTSSRRRSWSRADVTQISIAVQLM